MSETLAADLMIRAADVEEIDRTLDDMVRKAKARCALLINRNDGSEIAAHGFLETLDTMSLAALAAGAFASAREIARLVGEPEFSVLFHQGKREHVHVNIAGEHGLVLTLFDDRTTVGLVRICARQACEEISRVLSRGAR